MDLKIFTRTARGMTLTRLIYISAGAWRIFRVPIILLPIQLCALRRNSNESEQQSGGANA